MRNGSDVGACRPGCRSKDRGGYQCFHPLSGCYGCKAVPTKAYNSRPIRQSDENRLPTQKRRRPALSEERDHLDLGGKGRGQAKGHEEHPQQQAKQDFHGLNDRVFEIRVMAARNQG